MTHKATSFFGSHPGGNGTMAATCGTDATDAYMTKDPYASSSSSRSAHSSRARSMLASYYLGDLGQSIKKKTTTPVINTTPKINNFESENENEYDD